MPNVPSIRIGQGFDVHAFGEGDHVMLGDRFDRVDRGDVFLRVSMVIGKGDRVDDIPAARLERIEVVQHPRRQDVAALLIPGILDHAAGAERPGARGPLRTRPAANGCTPGTGRGTTRGESAQELGEKRPETPRGALSRGHRRARPCLRARHLVVGEHHRVDDDGLRDLIGEDDPERNPECAHRWGGRVVGWRGGG